MAAKPSCSEKIEELLKPDARIDLGRPAAAHDEAEACSLLARLQSRSWPSSAFRDRGSDQRADFRVAVSVGPKSQRADCTGLPILVISVLVSKTPPQLSYSSEKKRQTNMGSWSCPVGAEITSQPANITVTVTIQYHQAFATQQTKSRNQNTTTCRETLLDGVGWSIAFGPTAPQLHVHRSQDPCHCNCHHQQKSRKVPRWPSRSSRGRPSLGKG